MALSHLLENKIHLPVLSLSFLKSQLALLKLSLLDFCLGFH